MLVCELDEDQSEAFVWVLVYPWFAKDWRLVGSTIGLLGDDCRLGRSQTT